MENDPAAQEVAFLNMRTTAKFLSDERAFARYPLGVSLAILKFLGYTDVEMNALYKQLVFEQNMKNFNGVPKSIPKPYPDPIPEVTPCEKGWQYYETNHGEIFRTCRRTNFLLLKGGRCLTTMMQPQTTGKSERIT